MTRKPVYAHAALCVALAALTIPFAWNGLDRAVDHALGPLDFAGARKVSVITLDRNDTLLRAFTTPDGRWRLPAEVTQADQKLLDFLVNYEDRRFYRHNGIDVYALGRAFWQLATQGHVVSGGSTLTMQVARLLEPRGQRTIGAKLRQMLRALAMERRLTKREILALYLNLAPYGGNVEGIRAASWSWFGKEPLRLSAAEAALLVALPQSPETRRPDRFANAAKRARDRVLERAVQAGLLPEEEAHAARAEKIPTQRRPFPALAPHASEEMVRASPDVRIHHMTLDARLQGALEALARDNAAKLGPKLSIAIIALDQSSGAVRAHVGSADYFSEARAGSIDMTQALRSPGSTLKPFIYALAFDQGLAHPETMLEDRPTRYGAYAPENFDLTYQGDVSARRALQLSLNVPAIALLNGVGPSRLLARLRNAGARLVLPDESVPGLAVGLGGLGISLMDLARLYAGLAAGGTVPEVTERASLPWSAPVRHLVGEAAAWHVGDVLRGAPPPANAPAGRIAFKTGTSYGYRDAFAIGYDSRMTIAVWVGRADNGAVPGLVGRQVAAPILFDAFSRLSGDVPLPPPPPRDILQAANRDLPPPLRQLRKDSPKAAGAILAGTLKIAYPPDGARIDLGFAASRHAAGLADDPLGLEPLALKAHGGVPPLTWLVNGVPVRAAGVRRTTSWQPDGSGFARVSVMDAAGAADSVVVRIE